MKRFFQALILLFGVTLYSQDSLSIKDGAHGYDKDFVLNIFLKTDAKKSFGTTTGDKQLLSSGTTTETKVNKLIDNTQNFKSSVNVGDVVRNKTDNTYAFIWGEDPDGDGKYEITSDTSLTLSTDIMESGEEYEIGFGLLDSNKTFTSSVSVGDLVRNITEVNNETTFINKINDDTSLDLSRNIIKNGEEYEIHTALKALQFDLEFRGNNFNYKPIADDGETKLTVLNKDRLGGDDSDHIIDVREVGKNSNNKTEKLRILIYSPSNKNIPTGNGNLLNLGFHNNNQGGVYDFNLVNVNASTLANTKLSTLKLKDGNITTLVPHFSWTDHILDFGSVYKNSTADRQWVISNLGTEDLNVSLNKSELTKFSLTQFSDKSTPITWPQKIAPNGKLDMNVRVNSSVNGTFEESLFLDSDDPVDSRKGVKEFKFVAKVYNDNKVIVQSNADAENKKTSDVKVSINGDEDITSFQFDLTAENSKIELISKSASLLKSGTDHVISSNVRTDESGNKFLRVVAYSPSNAVLAQPIGEIVKFSVKPDKIVNPGSYPINISNVVLTNKALTNVSYTSENGSINLITGRLAFKFPPVTGDDSKRQYILDLGEIIRNSYNKKNIPYFNSGNKKLTINSASSTNADVTIIGNFPLEMDPDTDTSLEINLIPSNVSNDFSTYVKFNHDGGNEMDSILVKGTLKNRNTLVMKNSYVDKGKVNTIPISLLNSIEVKGMQFDLSVPKETKSFTWTLTADSDEDFTFAELSNAKDPGITHYVGDEINFVNNAGTTHPLYIVTGLGNDGGYDATKQLAGVTNQGATSGTVKVDLSVVSPGTYYYICGNHKSMQGTITILPKFSINASSSDLNATRTSDFILTQSSLGGVKYRFLIYSNNNSLFSGNMGDIFNMPLSVATIDNTSMDIVDGAYDVVIDNIIISGKENSNITTESTSTGIIVIGGSSQNEPEIDPNQVAYLKENPALNTYFYKVKATDADENNFLDDFKIVNGNDDGTFGIISENGDLYVAKPQNVDYEIKQSYSLGITVSDGFTTSAEETVVVKIVDDPNPFVINDFTVNVYRDNNKGGVYDDDSDDIRTSSNSSTNVSYELLSGNDKDVFSIDASSGKLTFSNAPVFASPTDSNKNNIYEVSIKVVSLDDTKDDAPVITSEKTISIKEGTSDALTVTSMLSSSASDIDGDGVVDSLDNCPNIANSNQRDYDSNGEGDVCEDSDGDGVLDNKDTCPMIPNADQADSDFDGIGDVCEDSDSDGVIDSLDNCLNVANLDQADLDGDGIGDVCDNDKDGDTILNNVDNCPTVANTDQADADKDNIGDICDDDDDNDQVLDINDQCPNTPEGSVVDINGCAIFVLPVNNNKVEVTSATCIGNTDGSIGLSVEDNSYDYTITITGKDDVAIAGEDKTASVTGLAKGTYSVCFKVDGQADYEQCFEVVIGEPKALSAFIDVDNDKRTTSVQLSGSNLYNIDINGQRHLVKGDNFTTTLPTGLSIIKISTNLECQGVIEREIFISEDIHYYPNPTNQDVSVHVSGEDTTVQVSVFSEKGDLIYTQRQQIQDFSRKTKIDLSRQITGTYIVVMDGPTVRKTFKIVKR